MDSLSTVVASLFVWISAHLHVVNADFKEPNYQPEIKFIPHKELSKRSFVLYPLREISPDWIDPRTKKNIDYFIKNLQSNNEITKLSENGITNHVK